MGSHRKMDFSSSLFVLLVPLEVLWFPSKEGQFWENSKCSGKTANVHETFDTKSSQGLSVSTLSPEKCCTRYCDWTLFISLMGYLSFQPFPPGPQIRFSGYAGVSRADGEQGLRHFLPPHQQSVFHIFINRGELFHGILWTLLII